MYENKNNQINTQAIVYNNVMVNKITNISLSRENSLFLNERGDVFSFGKANRGRLGLGDDFLYKNEIVPYRIDIDIKFIDLKHTSNNVLLISEDNKLYGSGLTNKNQLSEYLFGNSITYVTKIDISNISVRKISGGLEHTVVIDTSGCIWTCGSNEYGQLGYERDEHLLNLELLDEIYYNLFIDDNSIFIKNAESIYGNDVKNRFKRLYLQDKILTDKLNSVIEQSTYTYVIRNNMYYISSTDTLEDWASIDISGVTSITVKIKELIHTIFGISLTKSIDKFMDYILTLPNFNMEMTIKNFLIQFKELLLSYLDFYRFKKIDIYHYGNIGGTANLSELDIVDIQCGDYSTYILDSVGRVYACGKNDGGQLGVYNIQYNYNIHSNKQYFFKRIDLFIDENNIGEINNDALDIWMRDGSVYNIKDSNNNEVENFTKQLTNNISSIQNSPPNIISCIIEKDIPSLIIVTFDKTINTDRNLEIIKNSISTEKNNDDTYNNNILKIELHNTILKIYYQEDFYESDYNIRIRLLLPDQIIEDNLLMGTNGYQVEYDFYDVVFNINSTNIIPRLVDSYIDKSTIKNNFKI